MSVGQLSGNDTWDHNNIQGESMVQIAPRDKNDCRGGEKQERGRGRGLGGGPRRGRV